MPDGWGYALAAGAGSIGMFAAVVMVPWHRLERPVARVVVAVAQVIGGVWAGRR